jgi:hypothetical protein
MKAHPHAKRQPAVCYSGRVRGLRLGIAVAALAAAPSGAAAHGGLPQAQAVARVGDAIVVSTTFGLVLSADAGATWSWVCPEAIPTARRGSTTPVVLADAATLFVASQEGLLRGEELGCAWTFAPAELEGRYVADVVADPTTATTLYTLTSDSGAENHVYRSTDSGATWAPLPGALPAGYLPERVRVAPSSPTRIYVSGAFPGTATSRRVAAVFSSDDGGSTWTEHDFALETDELEIVVLAVDPASPDTLWARVRGELHDRLVESADGAATFRTLARLDSMPLPVGRPFGFAVARDGSLWFGNPREGLVRTVDRVTVEEVDKELALACVAAFDDGIWACGDGFDDGFSVGRTASATEPFAAVLAFSDIEGVRSCGAGSGVPGRCALCWSDLERDLMLVPPVEDAGVSACATGPLDAGRAEDAGVAGVDGSPSMDASVFIASGGACCAVAGGAPADPCPGAPLFALALVVALLRRYGCR